MTTDRLVAWRVITRGPWPDAGIYAAATRARAKALNLAAAREAGFMVAWNDLIARRAPEFDGWVARQGLERGWNEEYARRCLDEDGPRIAQDAPESTEEG
jgi:hypothetical protein